MAKDCRFFLLFKLKVQSFSARKAYFTNIFLYKEPKTLMVLFGEDEKKKINTNRGVKKRRIRT